MQGLTTILALVTFAAFTLPQAATQPGTKSPDDALKDLVDTDPDIFAHLARIIAHDGDLGACCPGDDARLSVDAFRLEDDQAQHLFVFTGAGEAQHLQILRQDDSGLFAPVFSAFVRSIQMSNAGEATELVSSAFAPPAGPLPAADVACIAIDAHTVLCAFDGTPPRIIIICKVNGHWQVCYDSGRNQP